MPWSRRSLEDTLINTPVGDVQPVDAQWQEVLYLQYTQFVIMARQEKQSNSFRFQLLSQRKKSPLEWWLTDGGDYPDLQKIAIKLFSVATSSAAPKRNFLKMGFIHSKLRNSLTPDTFEKLVFIKSNLATVYDYGQ